ncbi:MAG: MCE family protein [Flavobacteriales bacterium]|nr:MCE family protein [Flavobacteriales bacterium]
MKIGNEIKVGGVIILALGLLYFGVNYLKGSDIFSKARMYVAIYDDIADLSTDNKVIINGYKVGRVVDIRLLSEENNRILVLFEVSETELTIPIGTTARIISTDLLDSKAIRLELGDGPELHENGDTLISGTEEELKAVIEQRLAPLQSKIERVIDDSRKMIESTKLLIDNTTIQVKKAETSLDIINKTTADIDKLVIEQNGNLTRVLGDITAIASNIRNNSKQINTIIQNVATISDSLTRANYASAIQNASNALLQLDSLVTMINSGQGSLGMLLNDDKLYNNLEEASLEIDKLAEDLRVNPGRYVHFSVFGKREKSDEKPKKKDRSEDSSEDPKQTP